MSIYTYNLKKELLGCYKTITDAANGTGLTPMQVTEALQGKYRTIRGYVFSGQQLSKR